MIDTILSLKGDKYSPNLNAWLKQWAKNCAVLPSVYETPDRLMIGFTPVSSDTDFIGGPLISVLCNGAKQSTFCVVKKGEWKQLPNFWSDYIKIGRCAIDQDHRMFFIGDDDRWKAHGDVRVCQWCGHEQVKLSWVEQASKSEWVNA